LAAAFAAAFFMGDGFVTVVKSLHEVNMVPIA
jgi:hypothetical protein